MSQSYDYVVIGAGSGGCAVAARLAEDPSARVLLIEAGGSNRRLDVKAPIAFSNQFHTKVDWDYWTQPEPHLHGRRLYSPRGKMLGGSSSMNAQIYMRGCRLDYDGWAEHGAPGWSFDEVLPFFRRSERNTEFKDEYHGTAGPLRITKLRHLDPVTVELIDAAAATGIPRNNDFNGARQDGVGPFQVTHHNGMRFSSAEAYLAHRPKNLTVRSNTLVTRIVLDGDRAAAVEVADGKGRPERIGVDAELILAAGAFNTPALLQLSGIGPAGALRDIGIEPLVDLPAVGQNLMEHPLIYITYELAGGRVGLFDAEDPRQLLMWLLLRRGKLTSNFAEAGAFLRSDPSLPAPDLELHMGASYFFDHSAVGWDSPAATIAPSLIGSESRGTVMIRSDDPSRKPAVTYNMLSRQSEVDALVDAVLRSRQIAAVAQERGVLGPEITPGPVLQSRQALADWVRATCQHTYHPACTARIGTPEDGVVDPQLRVHGVEGLRIADASVMPTVPHGNTHAPTVMIGERCADFGGGGGGSARAPQRARRADHLGAADQAAVEHE